MAADDALRIARLADRTGFWPHLTDDPVHDFMLREALSRRLDAMVEAERRRLELDAKVKQVEQDVMKRVRGPLQ